MNNEDALEQIFAAPFVTVCELLNNIRKDKNNVKEERVFEFGDVIFTLTCEGKGENNAE